MYVQMVSALVLYGAVLVGIGLASYFRSKKLRVAMGSSSSEFILGGRSVNFWITALSAHASDMSQWLLMGFPAIIYTAGAIELWAAIGLVLGMWFTWQFVAPKLRVETERLSSLTLSSYFERRLNDTSGLISLMSALLLTFFFTIYLSTGAKAIGFLLQACFGINSLWGASAGMALVVLYTFLGGFIAVAWTDCFQAVFLLCMALLTPLVAFTKVGGLHTIIAAASQQGISLSLIPEWSFSALVAIILGPLAWGLGYCGMPHILTKFMGAADASEMYKSKYIGITWQIMVLSAAASVGFIGRAFFVQGELAGRTELIFIMMSQLLFSPFVVGCVVCGILAAIISTMDSQMLVVASSIAEDVYRNFFKKNATQREIVWVSRLSTIMVALFALSIAFYAEGTIYELIKYAWAGLGASFGPLVLMCLYSHSINRYGALAGMLSGGAVAGIWRVLDGQFFHFGISEMAPGFAMGLLTIYTVSAVTRKKV